MPTLFQELPPELLGGVIQQLPWESRLSLSRTSSGFRVALAAHVFRAIKVSNRPDTNLDDLRALAEKYETLVDEVHFVGSRDGLDNKAQKTSQEEAENETPSMSRDLSQNKDRTTTGTSGDGVSGDAEYLLPTLLRDVLSGTVFSQAKTVRVSFDFDFDYSDESENIWEDESELIDDVSTIYVFEVPEETLEVIEKKEDRYPWRQLMAQTWATLAENQNVRKVVMERLIPKPTSTFFSPAWSSFIERLDDLDISGIWSEDNGAGWHANTLDGYLHFEAHMSDYFFEHARKLTQLRLSADSKTAFGAEGDMYDCATPLEKHHLPHLQKLELQHILISPKLVDFVLAKGDTLWSLRLVDCHASTDVDEDFTWARFLTSLDKEGLGLRELEIAYETPTYETPLPMLDSERWGGNRKDNEEKARRVQGLREEGRKGFSYGGPSDKYGDIWVSEDDNYEAFVKGDDHKAYEALMERVRQNAGASI